MAMNLLIIAAGVALVVVWTAAKKKPALKPLVTVLAVVLVAAAGVRLYSEFQTGGTYTSDPESALGYVIGEKIAGNHPGGGTVLAVQEQPEGPRAEQAAAARIEGLESALSGSGLTVVRIELAPGSGSYMEPGRGFPVSQGQAWVAEHPDAVAVVSFTGFPEQAAPSDCKGWPPFYVFASGSVEKLVPMVGSGMISSLVVYRSGVNPMQKIPAEASPRQLFDMRYEFAAGR